ncbi:MFS transporter-like protein [Cucurbitaria berberidis CBS 394.84]|uniref:MFS transporter-like protein n=1 Tax=Cucurbitaria berberidis CBS 394.84 TaxID=1168544 RepID=A0A9P4GD77_9PLEO|nr:MFS transporter-like protein [Cucurbitaria berberidis CBS 394.84]KAF1843099.1 MFS transporter-like protein [Cucurbitaria berberidis CBS 394.84]
MGEVKFTDKDIQKLDIVEDAENRAAYELTEEERIVEKKLVRKIDFIIMPIILTVYLLNWIDRNNYASARLAGLEKDLGMTLQQYQTGLSILFVGYILGQIPSNMMLNYFGRPSWYLGFFTIAWGLVSALTSLTKSFSGIVACRFFLGIVEAPFFPGVLFYLSKWYTKKEMNLRMSIFYSGALIAGAFGNLIAAGILNGMDGKLGMSAWRWMYIIEGVITVAMGIVVCLYLPDFPQTWKSLTAEQKHVANRRLALEAADADVDEEGAMSQLKGLKLALTDVKTWLFVGIYMCLTGAQGFGYYFPTLARSLGYSRFISLLLVAPPHVFMTIWSYCHGIVSDRYETRFWFAIYPIVPAITGFVLFMTTDAFGPKYFSFFLMMFLMTMNGTIFSWISGILTRPPAKRAAAYALINSLGNSVTIWTPYTYLDNERPYFYTGIGICAGLMVIAALLLILLRFLLIRENNRLASLENENMELSEKEMIRLQRTAETEGISVAEARQLQKGFRYPI